MSNQSVAIQSAIAFQALKEATTELARVQALMLDAERTLEIAKTRVLLENSSNPKVLGANEAIRSAMIRDLLTSEHITHDKTSKQLAKAQLQLRLTQIDVDAIKTHLRCLEVGNP